MKKISMKRYKIQNLIINYKTQFTFIKFLVVSILFYNLYMMRTIKEILLKFQVIFFHIHEDIIIRDRAKKI